MRGMTNELTIGERVAWYRRRRGMSQEVLAAIVERTVDWVRRSRIRWMCRWAICSPSPR
jgi:hypothetical protein